MRVDVDDAVVANYERMRRERGWSWSQLAEQFDRDALEGARSQGFAIRTPGAGYRQLAAWARVRAREEDETEEVRPVPAGPPPKRDTRQRPPERTA